MTDAPALLASLRAGDFTLAAESGRLLVSPGARLTPDQRGEIAAHRDALLGLLAWERSAAAMDALAASGWQPWDWPVGVPVLAVRLGGDWRAYTPEEWADLQAALARHRKPPSCPHAAAKLWRVPFRHGGGFHLLERCEACGANVRGPGRWVPLAEVRGDPATLPVLGGGGADLFAGV